MIKRRNNQSITRNAYIARFHVSFAISLVTFAYGIEIFKLKLQAKIIEKLHYICLQI